MNKVIQANLGGLAFTFDDEAYALLDDYLDSLNGYFRGSPGDADIMHDIEARLSELFTQNLKGRSIVTAGDVTAATATLGTPEQLTGQSASADTEDSYRDFSHRRRTPTGSKFRYSRYGRKLMRDPDRKAIAGVCSGLSAYFGIDNPGWIRAAFLLAFFGAGVGLIPYIVLWVIMPMARTAGDKLAMRGEPIDLEHISTQVEGEVRQITSRIEEWGNEVNERQGWSKSSWSKCSPRNRREQRRREREERERDENYV